MPQELTEPAIKRIKSSYIENLEDKSFSVLLDYCYDLKFNILEKTQEQEEELKRGLQTIQEILEKTNSSRDISFGKTRVLAKINWGKCLSLLLEGGAESLQALSILTGKLNPGAGLL